MGLIQENIKVRVNNFNKNHFESLGYFVEINSYINIKVEELPIGSGLKVKVKIKEQAINNLINKDKNNDIYIYDIENKSEKLLKCNEL